ncbi:MAG: hypothetical protein AB1758_00495 [Candidatus Eremiobacterota bacterium]
MNRCPKCHEFVTEMAVNCRFCGEPIDEKTLFLAERELMDEVQVARDQAAQKMARQRRLRRAGQGLALVGFLATLAGLTLVRSETLALPAVLAGLSLAGCGALLMAMSRR